MRFPLQSEALEEEHCPSTRASFPFPSVPISLFARPREGGALP